MPNQMQTPTFPTIPVPDLTPNGMLNTLLALKKCVEMLTGVDLASQSGNRANRFAPHVFIQNDPPTPYLPGDMWVATGTQTTFSIWDGTQWLKIATPPA
jgi:hypothetical protein